jgi:hypothetical protein
VFHQGAVAILNAAGFTPLTPFCFFANLPARIATDLVFCILGRLGSSLWVVREVVPVQVLLLWIVAILFGCNFSDAGSLVRRLPAEMSALATEWDVDTPHPSRPVGIRNRVAPALSTVDTARSTVQVLDQNSKSPDQQADADETPEYRDPHHEVEHR